ncbi:SET domain-containing protein 7 [Acrodontium crateriforme]|uniref:SET domain-containing protein 7 n=1 Tax=Acrodontium crateriforme TaxID=150365 RepID=A0AAQ3RA02_9PEZI|nr:SET domain-containing protein 7 [Acrodontium crateriforme]
MSSPINVNLEEDGIALERFTGLVLIMNTPKGRGVFASKPIPAGTTIDICAALVLSPHDAKEHISHTELNNYTYNWPYPTGENGNQTTQAVVFGLGSLFNHSTHQQNVGWTRDLVRQVVTYRTLRDVRQGEELCISYGGHLTFVDADAEELKAEAEAEARDGGEAALARIELV